MMTLGYHASHEQFSPSTLLDLVIKAEKAGFKFALSSDHFYPWSNAQGNSGYAWAWLGAALAKTQLPMGVVTCPYVRYNPAIIAQAIATLLEMFPDRFWVALGSGQMLNEGIVNKPWPIKSKRNEALEDAVEVMKQLWKGEKVNYSDLFDIREARLYTRPPHLPEIIGAAITPSTARSVSKWADTLVTINKPLEQMEEMVKAWRGADGLNKPMILKLQISYDPDREKAKQMAYEQWKTNIFGSDLLGDLRTPEQFEQAAEHVKPDDMEDHVIIGNDPDFFIDKIRSFEQLGFDRISVHNVNKRQEPFINFFSKKILPHF